MNKEPSLEVLGIGLNGSIGCKHYRSPLDVIAILCPCHQKYYACHLCHLEIHGRPMETRAVKDFQVKAVLCRNCHIKLSISNYLSCQNRCPHCRSSFNPGCKQHRHLYFQEWE
ncbi:MAG: hypothetical protein V4489_09880 [Chlamydiota bacterium]